MGGNFVPGSTKFSAVFELKNSPLLLVIAGGTCYFMNRDNLNPVGVFGVGFSAAMMTYTGQLLLEDQTDLTIVEPEGKHWQTERISLDGIKELRLNGNTITGLAYDPFTDKWLAFSYNIDIKILKGGSYKG